MLGKLRSVVSYSAVDCDSNVNEATIYIKVSLSKNTHKTILLIS